jgi:hypothetical protein
MVDCISTIDNHISDADTQGAKKKWSVAGGQLKAKAQRSLSLVLADH